MDAWNEIDEWVDRYVRGSLSTEDRVKLVEWLDASPENAVQFRKMLRAEMRVSAAGKWKSLDQMQGRVWERIAPTLENRKRRLYSWGVRVAAVIVVLFGVLFVLQTQRESTEKNMSVASVLQMESGSPKAILVTNTGEKIELKEGETRQVADIFGVGVIQDSTGGVRFEDKREVGNEVGNSTIVVPEKGEYFVVLSDGTKVWINSGSELEFPNRFNGDVREVKLKGEAYFEVVANARKPFYVQAGEAKVQVLGTAFNVMAYQDDRQMEVALLRGKVSFDVAKKAYVLAPGEIATLDRESGKTTVRKGDVAAIVDWKAGCFNFEDMPLEDLVVKLKRWYGVEFDFRDEKSRQLHFSGAITKYRDLGYILDMISKTTDVEFLEEDKKIIVGVKNSR